MVHIEENGQIYCGQDVQSMIVCDFFGSYAIDQLCGNCPLVKVVGRCLDTELNVSIGDNLYFFE